MSMYTILIVYYKINVIDVDFVSSFETNWRTGWQYTIFFFYKA